MNRGYTSPQRAHLSSNACLTALVGTLLGSFQQGIRSEVVRTLCGRRERFGWFKVEGWSYITQDGKELWFTRTYLGSPAIYRSVKANGPWSERELIVSQFACEPSVDGDGNIYFVHHSYTADSRMIEADIYTAQRK